MELHLVHFKRLENNQEIHAFFSFPPPPQVIIIQKKNPGNCCCKQKKVDFATGILIATKRKTHVLVYVSVFLFKFSAIVAILLPQGWFHAT